MHARTHTREHMHTHTRTSRSRVDLQEVLELFHKDWVIRYIIAQCTAAPVSAEELVNAHVNLALAGFREFSMCSLMYYWL